jgi:glycosyltransferase involved in cell wall biosynthesis
VVSVVLSAHNDAANIQLILQALTRQTFTMPFEVLIADDGGNDSALAHVRDGDWPFEVRYIWSQHRGFRLPHNYNLLIRAANANLIALSDCGCIPSPGWLEALYFSRTNEDTLVCGMTRDVDADLVYKYAPFTEKLFEHSKIERREKSHIPGELISCPLDRDPIPREYSLGVSTNFFFSRETALSIGGFDEEYDEYGLQDYEFTYRWLKAGYNLKWEPKAMNFNIGPGEKRPIHQKVADLFSEMTGNKEVQRWVAPVQSYTT